MYRMSARRLVDQRNDIFDQILQGEESGTLSAEEKKCLEERALETGLQGLFMVRLSSHPIFPFSVEMSTYVADTI